MVNVAGELNLKTNPIVPIGTPVPVILLGPWIEIVTVSGLPPTVRLKTTAPRVLVAGGPVPLNW
jgi:hypothetical protein